MSDYNEKTDLSSSKQLVTHKVQDHLIDGVNTDEKFVKFLMADLFSNGLHVWWFVGLLSILSVAFIFLTFFASLIDSHYLSAGRGSDEDRRRLSEYHHLQNGFQMPYGQLQKLATLVDARHRLGNPSFAYSPSTSLR